MSRSPIHFIAGLPRSGSTLLAAILGQNPRFHTGVTSPVAALVGTLMPQMGVGSEFAPNFDDERRRRILRGLFDLYYGPRPADSVLFDTNRNWPARMALIGELFPDAKVVCLVRDVGWVLDSFERLLRHNPTQVTRALGLQAGSTVYARAAFMMHLDKGLVGLAWASLREAWYGEAASRLIVIEYDNLVADPTGVVARLYAALGEPAFTHDFANLSYDAPDAYDDGLGMPGLHRIRPNVAAEPRAPCLPPELFTKYAQSNFWRLPQEEGAGPLIL